MAYNPVGEPGWGTDWHDREASKKVIIVKYHGELSTCKMILEKYHREHAPSQMILVKHHSELAPCKMILLKYHNELAPHKMIHAKYHGELAPCQMILVKYHSELAPCQMNLPTYHNALVLYQMILTKYHSELVPYEMILSPYQNPQAISTAAALALRSTLSNVSIPRPAWQSDVISSSDSGSSLSKRQAEHVGASLALLLHLQVVGWSGAAGHGHLIKRVVQRTECEGAQEKGGGNLPKNTAVDEQLWLPSTGSIPLHLRHYTTNDYTIYIL